MGDHMAKHGDGVKDVSFLVEDLDAIYKVPHLHLLQYYQLICGFFFNFKHSKTGLPVSSGFIFMFLSKPFSVKIVDRYKTIIVS